MPREHSIAHIYKGTRAKNEKAEKKASKSFDDKYGKFAYILMQSYRRTKLFANLGRVTYGECKEYNAYPTVQLAAAQVTGKEDLLYKIPAALLQTKTVEKLVPWLECQTAIPIGLKMMEVVQ